MFLKISNYIIDFSEAGQTYFFKVIQLEILSVLASESKSNTFEDHVVKTILSKYTSKAVAV